MIKYEYVPLVDRINELLEYISCHDDYTEINDELLEIYEGDLAPKVLGILKSTLSEDYYKTIASRVIPINFMPKFIDKMAQVYSVSPVRTCGSEQAFIDNYEKMLDINAEMSLADEYANIFKGYALEPFVDHMGKPSMRSIPFNQFLVKGEDPKDRRRPTTFIKFMGVYERHEDCPRTGTTTKKEAEWYIAYTEFEIMAFDADKNYMGHITEDLVDGKVNPIGRIPFVYGNRSKQRLLPTQDTDLGQMIKMFPVLFTDLGGAIMYQCFTIMYGVDVDTTDIKMSPNAFWDIKSNPASDKNPQIGTINPSAQVDKVLAFITNILGAWAESRSIKIGNIGSLDGENMASGVSKIVDNMDTYEVRKKAIPFFQKEEKDLWYLLALMNNHWLKSNEINLDLYPTSQVNVNTVLKEFSIEFEPPRPLEDRNSVVDTQIKELNNNLTTERRAIEKINPDMDEKEINKLVKEIEQSNQYNFDENDENDQDEDETGEENINQEN